VLRLVFISNCAPCHYYLVQQVALRWPLRGLLKPVWMPAERAPRFGNFLRHPLASLTQRLHDRFYGGFFQRLNREAALALYGTSGVPRPEGAWEVPAAEINSAETVRRVQALQPDLLVACGAPILREELRLAPKLGALNLHYGIAPAYRGEHTLFWSLYRRDYDGIGVTLHYISKEVDGGDILAQGCPEIAADDSEALLLAKCARLASAMLIEFLEAVERGQGRLPGGRRQEAGAGRCYRLRDRKIRHDLVYRFRREVGAEKLVPRPGRLEKFYG
jgi:methionyl-tRNA formyltransferase